MNTSESGKSESVSSKAEAYSIGRFVPSLFQSEVIEREIRPLLPSCCQHERISVRVPMGIEPHPDNLEWHQDGGGLEGTTRHMVVWASEHPTEIKASTGEVLSFAPFDVIFLDNDHAVHRQPRGTDERSRWFVSVRCSGV